MDCNNRGEDQDDSQESNLGVGGQTTTQESYWCEMGL